MKISTKGRYALRLMLDLALNDTGEHISLKSVSQRQGISVKYLEQIVAQLMRADYVSSVRGPQGGYRLTRCPEEYTVGMILRLTEGSLAPVACLEGNADGCGRRENCATLEVYRRLNEAISRVVDQMSLADLVCLQKRKEEE